MTETIQTETMLDELLELTDTDKKAVARAVAILRHIQPDPQAQARLIVDGVEQVIEKREQKTRSFWRAVYQGLKQGANQSFDKLDKLFSGKDEK